MRKVTSSPTIAEAEGPEDFCDHDDYDRDILTGRATCNMCGHVWYQTAEEIRIEQEAQAAWDKFCEETNKCDGCEPALSGIKVEINDELPF